MILTALLNIIYWFVKVAVGVLPSVESLPEGFNNAIDSILTIIAQWETVIPVFSDLLTIILLMLSIEAGILTLMSINWVIKKATLSG